VRIKKIEILGFKSFCDRMVLSFSEPITAIVGPNGCGKSNVVDAIRWCMGEQSAKHLRGKEMQDVIFAGSDSRGPSGMCEVTLTFENDGRVPIDYMNFTEIAVSRRLFRDGTSEYLINKVPVRLRDVVDLFLGTGVGTKAYSIIEQGRVGLIVTSKPEDRRMLIEEAAGITKYKLKKRAAERKMEATRQNLLRVSDVLGEVERRLGSLRRQAQKAERYKKYKAEMRDIELWGATHRWLGFTAEDKVAQAALVALDEREQAEAAELLRRELDTETARAVAMDEERKLTGMAEELHQADSKVKLTESEIEFQVREAAELDRRGLSATGEIEELSRRTEELRREHEAAQGGAERLDREAAILGEELESAEDTFTTLKQELVRVQREVDHHKLSIAQSETTMARSEQALASLERREVELQARVGKLASEDGLCRERIEELTAHARTLGSKLAELKQTKLELGAQREQHERRLGTLKDQVGKSEMELETLRTELHRRKSRHASLKEIEERYEGFQRGVRAIMQSEKREHVRGLVADIVAAPAEYEVAVEAVLGDRLGSIIVESCEVGLEAIDYLKQKSEGRGTFIPVDLRIGSEGTDVVPSGARSLLELVGYERNYDRVATYLFGDVMLVDDLSHALALWRAGSRATFVTRDGEMVDAHGVVTGGSRDAGAGVLQQKREIRELEEIVARIEADYQEVLERHVTTKAEITAITATLEELRAGTHQGEIAIMATDKDLARVTAELERNRARSQALEGERAELDGARGQAAREAEGERVTLSAAREQHSVATRALLGHKEELERLLGEVENAGARATDLKVRVARAREQQGSAHQAAARLDESLRDLGSRRERLEKSIYEGKDRGELLRERVEAARVGLAQLIEHSSALAGALAHGRAEYETRMLALQNAESELKSLRQAHGHTLGELHAERARLADLHSKRGHLEEAMAERYQVVLALECGDHHLRPPIGEVEEARRSELKSLIERMGEINLMAIEECAELEQRFTFLSTQKADLECALDQLAAAIARINKASKARFEETFEAVNKKFQEVFPRLFRGGRAHLALTAAEDVLDAGVEIVSQPPGKKLQTVELLSGGEKALTAVALIFSIFLIKPSPFCLLDEVDAPLDEANVIRYNELIREMTDLSQFIVITHNKRTMEIADQLYGVTMEEPGISKLVTVNLTKGGRQAAA
jgi:chromosome segregation protein